MGGGAIAYLSAIGVTVVSALSATVAERRRKMAMGELKRSAAGTRTPLPHAPAARPEYRGIPAIFDQMSERLTNDFGTPWFLGTIARFMRFDVADDPFPPLVSAEFHRTPGGAFLAVC